MDFFDRPREPRRRPSQGGGGGGDRRQASEMGRAASAYHRLEERSGREQGRDPALHAGQGGELVDARRGRFRRRNPAYRDRQDPEDGVAGAVQGFRLAKQGRCPIEVASACPRRSPLSDGRGGGIGRAASYSFGSM